MLDLFEETLRLPGGHFHVLRGGQPGPRPLVLVLHGFPDHPPTFAPMLRLLVDGGWQVAAPWLRGYAPSVRSGPYTLERLGADVLELADALSPGHPVCVVGHDWGALATYVASAMAPHRIAAAVTMSVPHPLAVVRALPRSMQLGRSWYVMLFQLPGAERAARAGGFKMIDLLWRRWSPGLELDDEMRLELHRCLATSWPSPIEHYRALLRPLGAARLRATRAGVLGEPIMVPTLNLHGLRDGCVGVAATRGQERFFQGPFEGELIPDVGHFMHVEAPGAVAARVSAWLTRHA